MPSIVIDKLLTEKMRPQRIEHMILPKRISDVLSKGLQTNLMLYSPVGGTGKSSIAGILCKGFETLKLNGSSENGIDIIRNKVETFASTVSLSNDISNVKVIWIDEADGLSIQAWDALRENIEHYADSVRFICTCNKLEKIPGPIQSRFTVIPFYPINKDEEAYVFEGYCVRVKLILNKFNITYTDTAVASLVKAYFPDMRSVLNSIQNLQLQGVSELTEDTIKKTYDCSDLFELIVNGNDPVSNYEFIASNYAGKADDAMMSITRGFIDYIKDNHPNLIVKLPYFVIIIADYMDQLTRSLDPDIVLMACVFKLQNLVKQ